MNRNTCTFALLWSIAVLGLTLASCSGSRTVQANNPGGPEATSPAVTVGVVPVGRKPLGRTLTVSSELVPFQEIDVYAKEAGYVKELKVDYGDRVKAGQLLAILEIPELEEQLKQDDAAIKSASDQIIYAENVVNRTEAQHKALQLQFDRLDGVAKSKPGLVAQQEVDDAEGRALASAAQVEAARASLQTAKSQLVLAQAKRSHDQALFDYSKITAPFDGVVTQRYANFGTLMQAGTGSSTQAIPLVKLSEDDRFRLVIPVPESYVHSIHVNDPVQVRVPSLNQNFMGKVARFSVDVREDTRTMHTEVDVFNPNHILYPGLYAEATLTLERKEGALAVPLQAVDINGDSATVIVVTPDNKLEIRRITLGIRTPDRAEVLTGLNVGDQVVVSDRSGLKAGQPVAVKPVELVPFQDPNQQ